MVKLGVLNKDLIRLSSTSLVGPSAEKLSSILCSWPGHPNITTSSEESQQELGQAVAADPFTQCGDSSPHEGRE